MTWRFHSSDIRRLIAWGAARPLRNLLILFSFGALSLLNWQYPTLRFSSALANALLSLLFLLTPIFLVANGLQFKSNIVKSLHVVVLAPTFFALVWLIPWQAIRVASIVVEGTDFAHEKIEMVQLERS
jgi:hypothetical protein